MTMTLAAPAPTAPSRGGERFRLNRAGILNVWQYDDQEFDLAGGRLLLRGANGAGKSKTLEMLLPFALDGDKARITASAKHHTSLLWLMTDGYEGQARVGYVWVEFLRADSDGTEESFTCGIGIRASASARSATAWHFATTRRIGHDLLLEDDAGPLTRPRLEEALGGDGQVFERAAAYKEHIGRALFGLDVHQFDEVLRLLYWLRQPQVGEDIEPAKLAQQLSQALPQLDEQAVRSAGDTFDELTAFGEQIQRRAAAAEALDTLASAYAGYARAAVAERAGGLAEALRSERRARSEVKRSEEAVAKVDADRAAAEAAREAARAGVREDEARLKSLEASPEFRDQVWLAELGERADHDEAIARDAERRRAGRAGEAERRADTERRRADEARDGLRGHVESLLHLDDRQRRFVPQSDGVPVPTVLTDAALDRVDQVDAVQGALDRGLEGVRQARSAVTRRSAAVGLLRDAMSQADAAVVEQRHAERRAEQAEARWEQARAARVGAEQGAAAEHEQLLSALRSWAAEPSAPELPLPAGLTADFLLDLPNQVAAAATPELTELRQAFAAAVHRRQLAEAETERLEQERAAVERERDPAPPVPALGRTERRDGLALWQIVDFGDGLTEAERAGLEAALQAAGLLDALVRPGGLLLDPDQLDVVLTAPAPASQPSAAADAGTSTRSPEEPAPATAQPPVEAEVPGGLHGTLVPDLPPDSDLSEADVRRILGAIGTGVAAGGDRDVSSAEGGGDRNHTGGASLLVEDPARSLHRGSDPGADVGSTARVGLDGTWRLGPAHGRAAKPQAQYIGATARAQERVRRLVVLDQALAQRRDARMAAEQEGAALDGQIADLEGWVRAVPSGQPLLTAWTRVDERRATEDREELENRHAQHAAHAARTKAAEARDTVTRQAAEHQLPGEREPLEALAQALRALDDDLRDLAAGDRSIRRSIALWREAVTELEMATAALTVEQEAASAAAQRAGASRAEAEALRASVGDSVEALLRRIEDVRASRRQHEEQDRAAEALANQLGEQFGAARAEAGNARLRLDESVGHRSEAVARLVAVGAVPGMLPGAGATPEHVAAVAGLSGHPASEPVPRQVIAATDALAALSEEDVSATVTRVWRAQGDAVSGPAADHDPNVSEFGDLLAVSGRDDGGEAAVVDLAQRVRASVEVDRDLLTQREREQFERHVLGELGDAIRRCRRDAEELVAAMNDQLGMVTTSQGIRVRLRWSLRDDVPPEARDAVDLLVQPVAALIPEERAKLRDVLHRLIEASRAERPELSYREHLAAALDYRTWSQFTIRYSRPEKPDSWERLHRRSALSQGEQKVLCYLPLFAAAAAHFTSLAGAAPYAPRLVLLDDAFPKIDARTHPLLFGLLVQLDLDFVITSERLWGDFDTVPSLLISEALRDPSQRGIAHYQYRWDGRALHVLG